MVALRKQFCVSLEDIKFVSITCQHCGATLTLDMTRTTESQTEHKFFAPRTCQVCMEQHDSAIANLDNFRTAYCSLSAISKRLTFSGASEISISDRDADKTD